MLRGIFFILSIIVYEDTFVFCFKFKSNITKSGYCEYNLKSFNLRAVLKLTVIYK
jgi:hypothetical protein